MSYTPRASLIRHNKTTKFILATYIGPTSQVDKKIAKLKGL